MAISDAVRVILSGLYGREDGRALCKKIVDLTRNHDFSGRISKQYFSERDLFLITYADSLQHEGEAPLATLHTFATANLSGIFSHIHILPFFPYSSDDGFSVIDFYRVHTDYGDWEDIRRLGADFRLMFDLVLNHCSAGNAWFHHFLERRPGYEDFAIDVDPSLDLSAVVRPRALPLLTPFKRSTGETVHVWTTFSADQIDLNYKSIRVMETMIRVLLFYIRQGASALRLDAVAYLWKKVGTASIHLPETHQVVKLFRKILDCLAPDTLIITETNVPHEENISYFGNGDDEAQLVYNFTLPPLLLHTFMTGNAEKLSDWAQTLTVASESNTFFNFCASHDGIGLRPVEGILDEQELTRIIERVLANGGHVSYRTRPDGTRSPYELNISYLDALAEGEGEAPELAARRFLASQAIMLTLPGVPAVYIHSLLGSRNWLEGVTQTGRYRSINRRKLRMRDLQRELSEPDGLRSRIFKGYLSMARIRTRQPAFHPNAAFEVLRLDPNVFALFRGSGGQAVYTLTNIASSQLTCNLSGFNVPERLHDLISGRSVRANAILLAPFQYCWLEAGAD